jgi:hypothetical protein
VSSAGRPGGGGDRASLRTRPTSTETADDATRLGRSPPATSFRFGGSGPPRSRDEGRRDGRPFHQENREDASTHGSHSCPKTDSLTIAEQEPQDLSTREVKGRRSDDQHRPFRPGGVALAGEPASSPSWARMDRPRPPLHRARGVRRPTATRVLRSARPRPREGAQGPPVRSPNASPASAPISHDSRMPAGSMAVRSNRSARNKPVSGAFSKWARLGSNQRPPACEAGRLTRRPACF